MSGDLIVSSSNGVGYLRLNRPTAIHALNFEICHEMGRALLDWMHNPEIEIVMIDHAEGRGFCAGGDIRAIWESGRGNGVAARAFFHEEYRLNHLLFSYPKPVIAFMDGITMGGGVGISQPASIRVATERTVFAMPETGIGLFPDVGGGRYLSRLPGRVGQYLAATGARIDGADCLVLGLATHYVPSHKLARLKDDLAARPEASLLIVADAAEPPPVSTLSANLSALDRLFASDSAEAIAEALTADRTDFARSTLATLTTKSPQTIKVSLRELAISRSLTDFAAEMQMEYRIASRVCQMNDFLEGVRALIIDKTNDPKWSPDKLSAVTEADLDAIFAPLDPDNEWTPYPEITEL